MDENSSIGALLSEHGVTRRQFLKFCGFMAAVLALPPDAAGTIAEALAAAGRPRVLWLEFQDCAGDTESFIRAAKRSDPLQSGVTDPNIASLVLEVLSVDYHETLMVPSGALATKSRDDVVKNYAGQYICVVEGSIPAGNNGVYCTIGGRSAINIAREVCGKAKATIALGTCASFGGLPGAAPNPTGAASVKNTVPGLSNLVNIPGCPSNVVNLVATIVYLTTFGKPPALDSSLRPQFAYGKLIHDQCERRSNHDARKFVYAWGDAGHRQGWCLRPMGCHGPVTMHNCPTVKWNEGTCWSVQAGHGCISCASPNFWDQGTPFYHVLYHGDKTENDCKSCHG